ncbi:MAG TPA: glycosyltransferase family 4 protein [Gemmataceae bacterium]|nr:glycosyltransferase family 4 protein [Gemmataceae bacterium]
MRIAHFIHRYPPARGGSEAYLQRLSRFLAQHGHTVSVWTTNALDLEAFWSRQGRTLAKGEEWDGSVRVQRFGLSRWPGRGRMLRALACLPGEQWKWITDHFGPMSFPMWWRAGRPADQFDLVHALVFPWPWHIVCARRLARRQGIPFLITPFLHLGDPEHPDDETRRQFATPIMRSLLQSADRVFVQTSLERAGAIELGVEEARIVVQGLGVDAAECTGGNRARARAQWNVLDDEVVVGHLANLCVEKGSTDLLQAAAMLWKKGSRFRVVLAGTQALNFQLFWEQFENKELVVLAGSLDEQQKRDFFAGIDLFVLPSRSDSFGLVLLEAWANGLANIAYRAGGVAEVIHHDEDGILIRCGDLEALAGSIQQLIEKPELRQRLGNRGRERTQREFGWADKLRLVEQVYEEVVRGGKG